MQLSLLIQNVKDEIIRENFYRILSWVGLQPLLNCDFKFFEIDVATAQSGLAVRHGLGFVPKDILVLSSEGDQNYYFLFNQFDKTNFYLTTSGPVRLRVVAGSYSALTSASVNYPFVPPSSGSSVSDFTGDSGAGGAHGLVPAPSAGDAAANKFLKASGGWSTIPTQLQTFQSDTSWDGSTTTKDVVVSGSISDARKAVWQILDNANNYERIWCSIKATSASNVRVTVSPALPAGSYRLIGVSTA